MEHPKSLRDLETRIANSILLDGMIPVVGCRAFCVYTIIKLFANYTTGLSYPTTTTIMELAGIGSHHTIRKDVLTLQANGYLTFEYRKPRNSKGVEYGRKRYFYKLLDR